MKNLFFLMTVFFTQSLWAEAGLYTSDSKTPYQISEMNSILERITQENPERNILIYVHGRNRKIQKEWDKLSVLEETYKVKVIMFHWDAWSSVLTRAVGKAEAAADPLDETFKEIRLFKESHQDYFRDHKISLLCHSMGNLVLKFFTEKFLLRSEYSQEDPLFDNFMGVSPDVPLLDHRLWLSQFNLARKKFIMMNNRDSVLLMSYALDLKDKNPHGYRLGLAFDNAPGRRDQIKSKLVPDVSYIDLSAVLQSEHGYFMPKTTLMKTIFSKLTRGEKFDFSSMNKDNFKIKINTENNIFYVYDNK
ncbi:MAG: alpha/beta hydrolase [Bacteriovorax sp.]|nr:alpha/beta hydrolase [Bacteriovorax sp.]